MKTYYNELLKYKKVGLKEFNEKLIPTLNNKIIGVTCPNIRKIAKEFKNDIEFLKSLPHEYYEEDLLHAYMLSINYYEYEEFIELIEEFLPYLNNWSVCDTMAKNKKIILKNKDIHFLKCIEWINTGRTYYIRFGLLHMMCYYLTDEYINEIIKVVYTINNHDYYVDMMIAWLFATAMIRHEKLIIDELKKNKLNNFIIKKTISKSIESFRIKEDTKVYVKELRRLLF